MKLIIQTPDFKATPALEKFVGEQLEKISSYHKGIIDARVCLRIEKSDIKENKVCEIKLTIPGNDLFASRQTDSFEASVVKSIDALKHQIAHLKTVRDKKRTVSDHASDQ